MGKSMRASGCWGWERESSNPPLSQDGPRSARGTFRRWSRWNEQKKSKSKSTSCVCYCLYKLIVRRYHPFVLKKKKKSARFKGCCTHLCKLVLKTGSCWLESILHQNLWSYSNVLSGLSIAHCIYCFATRFSVEYLIKGILNIYFEVETTAGPCIVFPCGVASSAGHVWKLQERWLQ